MGAGAVGGYFGARLALAGNEVHLIARGEHLRTIREHGLHIQTRDGTLCVCPASATDDPAEVGVVELVLFTVKSASTREAAEAARPLVGEGTSVLVLQNGVENESVVAEVLGREHVVPGVAYVGAQVPAPGVILHTGRGNVALGEPGGDITDRVRAIRDVLEAAGARVNLTTDIFSVKWRKLMINAAFNPVTALNRMTVLQVLEDPELRPMVEASMMEVVEVGRALGHDMDMEAYHKALTKTPEMAHSRTSMLQDVEKGRPTEIDALCGAVVRAGRRVGVPTPVNQMLLERVQAIDAALPRR